VLKSKRDKTKHEWSQGSDGVWVPIEHPGELIVDPFAGTGERGRIAHEMGRRWLGCDINPERWQ
jgi:DNA modification methylase